MILTISGLVMLVGLGLLMYALATNGKLVEIGRIMFGVGLLCVLLNAGTFINLFPQGRIH